MTDFVHTLGKAFDTVAAEHGLSYREGGAMAWGRVGAAYLSFAIGKMPAANLRSLQYAAQELTGPVLLDCKWYDRLTELCMDGPEVTTAGIPLPDGGLSLQDISRQLFLEMLDFCREG